MNSKGKKTTEEDVNPMITMGLSMAIDLGASEIRGLVGKRTQDGKMDIVASEAIPSKGIMRGLIYNIDDVAFSINDLCKKMENRLENQQNKEKSNEEKIKITITKVYVALNGKSINTITNTVTRRPGGKTVTKELLDEFMEENRNASLASGKMLLDIIPQEYIVDDTPTTNPIGCPCEVINAKYKMLIGDKSLIENLKSSLEKVNLELAGYTISPIASADALLSENEKELGCLLVDFGASTTNVAIYYKNLMKFAFVIPIGSDTITNDLQSLKIVHEDAILLKKKGNCFLDMSKDDFSFTLPRSGQKEIKYKTICKMIESRMDNILSYVKVCIDNSNLKVGPEIDQMVITGRGSELRGLIGKSANKLGLQPHCGKIRMQDTTGNISLDNSFAVALGTLMQATDSCVSYRDKQMPAAPKKEKKGMAFLKAIGTLFDSEPLK